MDSHDPATRMAVSEFDIAIIPHVGERWQAQKSASQRSGDRVLQLRRQSSHLAFAEPRFPRWLLQLPRTVAPVAVARKFVHDPVVCMAISFFIGLILRSEALLSGHFEH